MSTTQTAPALAVTEQNLRDFHDKGYFLLPSVMTQEHLEIARDAATHYIDNIHKRMDEAGTDVLGISHRNNRYFVSNRWKEVPALGKFLFSNYMADICRATLGDNVWLFNEQYVIKAAEKGMKFAWHQDSGYIGHDHQPYLSCWCALDDMSEANGTVYMLPYERAGTRTWVRHQRDTVNNDLIGYFGDDPGEPVICPAGSIAVFSSVCFHRSGSNTTSKMRRVYLTQYSGEVIMTADGKKPWALADAFLEDGQITPQAAAWARGEC